MARKVHIRWMILAGVGAVAAGLLAWLFAPRPLVVDTAQVARGPVAETVFDQGVARVRRAYVISAPAAGRIERIELEVGDRVITDKTVAARLRPSAADFLDPRARAQAEARIVAAQSTVAAAGAQRDRLSADAERTARELARIQVLAQRGVLPTQTLENAQAAAVAARSAVRAAEAEVRARQAELAAARSALTGPEARAPQSIAVVSPASGVVTRLLQQSERTVAAGTPLIEVGATEGLEASIEFLSQDAVRIREGMAAEIYNWGGPGVIEAQVRRVEPQGFTKISALGVEEQRVLVMLQFTAPTRTWEGLSPGYRVWGRVFLRRTPSAIVAPLGALVRNDGGWAVYRVEDGRARLRTVRVGAFTGETVEILQGLAPGDRVVLFPSDRVRDGVGVKSRVPR